MSKRIKEFILDLFKYFLIKLCAMSEKQNNWNTNIPTSRDAGMYSQTDNSVQEN